jgi:hypothetical protein
MLNWSDLWLAQLMHLRLILESVLDNDSFHLVKSVVCNLLLFRIQNLFFVSEDCKSTFRIWSRRWWIVERSPFLQTRELEWRPYEKSWSSFQASFGEPFFLLSRLILIYYREHPGSTRSSFPTLMHTPTNLHSVVYWLAWSVTIPKGTRFKHCTIY